MGRRDSAALWHEFRFCWEEAEVFGPRPADWPGPGAATSDLMFSDRSDAGKKLALALEKYRGQQALVLAIPRGGVEVGLEVARGLDADFSPLISRKLPYPGDPEAGFGAIAEDGTTVILREAARGLSGEEIGRIEREQKAEIRRRVRALRGGRLLPDMAGRTIILVDDGLAMGSTMQAAIGLVRKRNAGWLVVAVPVASRRVAADMERLADEVVVLEKPAFFQAVAQAYDFWQDVSDKDVIRLLSP